jgi:hypothetical protein
MATTKNTTIQQSSTLPAVEQQTITSGSQVIQRPTANTSTEHALKEGN